MKTTMFRILALWAALCLPAWSASLTSDRIDGISASVAVKAPVRVATTASITLSGTQTIDGVAVVAEDRVLVKDQSTSSANGIYVVKSTAWERAKDFDGNRDVVRGTLILVTDGTTNSNTYWRVSASNPITIGTTSITFERAAGSDSSAIAFLQSGTGAVSRTVQDRERELVYLVSDFGGVCDNNTDIGPAAQLAVNAAATVLPSRGAIVELPAGLCKVSTQIAITTSNITLRGKGMYATTLAVTSTSLNPLIATTVTGLHIHDLNIAGPGAGSSAVGLQLTNVYESVVQRVHVSGFNVGVQLSPGVNSSYSNVIRDSIITGANTTNINALASTNSLRLYNVTLGGAPAARGLKVIDSTDFAIYGFNCEGVTNACIDVDATTDSVNYSGFLISGGHMEGSTSSVADIVLGLTNPIYSAVIIGNLFGSDGLTGLYPIRLHKAQNVQMVGNSVISGYASGSYPLLGTVSNVSSTANRWNIAEPVTIGTNVRIGGTDLNTAAASNLEVQGTSGVTIARDVNTTGSAMLLNFRQKDANDTWTNIGRVQGGLNSATAGSVTAELQLVGKVAGSDTTYMLLDNSGVVPITKAFAALGTPGNGRIVYCSDCTIASPCASGGSGAIAKRLNGAWICN